ncbi:MAG: hypothetical protein ACYTF1_03120 [Planctomycetota bacterium]
MGSKHDTVAKQIAKKKGTTYNQGKGPDVKTNSQVIEVETVNSVNEAPSQLRGYRKTSYIAGTDTEATKKALEVAEGTTLGVMNSKGKVIKRSTRKRK